VQTRQRSSTVDHQNGLSRPSTASVHDSVPFAMDGSYRAQVGLTP
jgi:hypothetical protein